MELARQAGATTEILESENPVEAITEFARQKRITQIFISHGSHRSWRDLLFGDPILRLVRSTEGIDVRVFPR
jgi:K+-sensing histidine kinase KdpD